METPTPTPHIISANDKVYINILYLHIYLYYRPKLRSQTSDNMDTWTNKKQRWEESEKRREDKRREEKKRRNKIREEKESEERRCRCTKR